MSKLNDTLKEMISQTKVFPVATASKEGMPNVVPISFVKVYDDDTVLVVDNFMNKTFKNLEENPQLSISVWNTDKAFQIKGQATIIKSGKPFDDAVSWVKEVMPQLNPKSAILVKITNIYNCQPGPDLGKEL
ncbi:pyridoxamine 5'-phosphate oxidase family protein [Desulfolucanica intricata]|uniref:pyridoxamine 5'-phosphate oxidase family protein n=1 Tax=Desulfolucanica intricata TaxID=1285191 RepID=UPI0008303818|nr:pyridoxamine 5'-phosphate oxidase family protein [Desulfolucanica intricata]